MKLRQWFLSLSLLCALSIVGTAQISGTNSRYFTSADIDGSTTGTHVIGTTLTSSSFVRWYHILISTVTTSESNNILLPAVFSVGTNSSSYDNISTLQTHNSVLNRIKALELSSSLAEIDEGVDIVVKVTSACTALIGTPTCKFKVTVFGVDHVYPNP